MKKKYSQILLGFLIFPAMFLFYWLGMTNQKRHIESCPVSKFSGNKEFTGQYYEDYVLSYVLSEVKNGVYVDVGVNDPKIANASFYFYKKGWKGVNIEPIEKHYKKLLDLRPEQININKAISNYSGKGDFFVRLDLDGHSSLKGVKEGKVEKITVEVTKLDDIFLQYNLSNVDFLKIDVEGAEAEVIHSLNLQQYRPKIIVLESVSPLEHFGFMQFEDYMIDNNYSFAMSDDLNRYYLRKESIEEFKEKFQFINSCVRYDKLARGAECYSKHKCSF